MKFPEGTVVICGTGQAGTVIGSDGKALFVLTANGEIWFGAPGMVREPQSQEDLDAAPFEQPERFKK